jgi:hypothetical protein
MNGLRIMDAPYLQGLATDLSTPAANTEAIVSYAADADTYHVLETIHFSYSASPAAGSKVSVEFDGVEVFAAYVTNGGPGPLCLSPALISPKGALMTVKLSAGGSGILGSLVCRHFTLVDET